MTRQQYFKLQMIGCTPELWKNPIALEPRISFSHDGKEDIQYIPKPYDRIREEICHLKIVSSISDVVTPENSERLLRGLKSIKEPVSFEIIGSCLAIFYLIVCQKKDKNLIISGLETNYKNIYIEEIKQDPLLNHYHLVKDSDLGMKFNFLDYYLPPPNILPIITFKSFATNPLDQIYYTLSTLKKEELGFYQVIFIPAKNNWHKYIRDLLEQKAIVAEHTFGKAMIEQAYGVLSDHEIKFFSSMASDKVDPHKPFYLVSIRAGAFSLPKRYNSILKMMGSAMHGFSSGARSFKYVTRKDYYNARIPKELHRYIFFNRVSLREGMLLNTLELAGLCHLPTPDILQNNDYKITSIPKAVRAPDNLNRGVTLGLNIYRGIEREVKLNKNVRNQHLYIVGKTRMGKSTLMLNLIYQDIINRECVVVIDPEGSLIEDVLNLVPHERIDDVSYFNAGDRDFPIGFNLLHAGNYREKGKLCNDIISIFEKLFEGGMTERMRRIFRRCLLCLLCISDSTMKDVELFLTNDAFRKQVLQFVQERDLIHFWQIYFTNYKSRLWSSIEAILTRLDSFLGDETIRNITCQRTNKLDFNEILHKKKIFLCNLNTKIVGEHNANILGQLIVAELQIAGMHREKSRLNDIYFYVDEFQNYITPDFKTLLSQGAKYRVNLCLAHQYVEQLQELKGALFGNVSTIVSYRLGERDAPILAKEFGVFNEQDILQLPKYHALVKVEEKSFTMAALQPPKAEYSNREEIIKKSREKYNSSRAEVEKEFKDMNKAIAEIKPSYKKEVAPVPENISQPVFVPPRAVISKSKEMGLEKEPVVQDESKVLSRLEQKLLDLLSRNETDQDHKKLMAELEITAKKLNEIISSLQRKKLISVITAGDAKTLTITNKARTMLRLPATIGKGGEQHKYFQSLIKKTAEDIGYLVTIEDKIQDGSVDLSLVQNDFKIACEISVTSTPEQEFGNIKKCLKAGFNHVMLCSVDQTFLDRAQELVFSGLEQDDQEKVSFLTPAEIPSYLKKMAIQRPQHEEMIKGRRVKTTFKPISETEEKHKREAITKLILQSMKKLEKED